MSNIEEQKKWIDSSSYEQLLFRWRHAKCGDSIFTGELGKYYEEKMSIKRKELSTDQQVLINDTPHGLKPSGF